MGTTTAISASVKPAANTVTQLYPATGGVGLVSGRRAVIVISGNNQSSGTPTALVYIGQSTSAPTFPGASWIEGGGQAMAASGGILERGGQIMRAGDLLWVESTDGNVAFRVTGLEEDDT